MVAFPSNMPDLACADCCHPQNGSLGQKMNTGSRSAKHNSNDDELCGCQSRQSHKRRENIFCKGWLTCVSPAMGLCLVLLTDETGKKWQRLVSAKAVVATSLLWAKDGICRSGQPLRRVPLGYFGSRIPSVWTATALGVLGEVPGLGVEYASRPPVHISSTALGLCAFRGSVGSVRRTKLPTT